MSLAKYATIGESLVALKLISTLVKRGYAVSIWNGGDEAEIENRAHEVPCFFFEFPRKLSTR